MTAIITSRRFLEALAAAGVIANADHVRRVVIDADVADVLRVYVERFGDERLVDVVRAYVGVEIRSAAAGVGVETPQPGGAAAAEPPLPGGRRPERVTPKGRS